MNSELNQSVILEAEVLGIQNVAQTDHSKLDNLDFEHSGHTGFQPAGNYVEDSNYTHTDNNYTTEEKTKLSNLENYDDTEIKRDIQSLEDTKVDREVNKGLSTNDYTNEEKSKLASLENYDDTEVKADISALEDIEETQNQEIVNIKANKADKSEIPDVSDFITNSVNDLINYYLKSETYTKTEVNNLISAITTISFEVVNELPQAGQSNIIYLVPSTDPKTQNVKDEYIWINNNWEKIGSTDIDLSNYVTTTQLNTALADYTTTANLTTLLAGKQNTIDSTHKLDADLIDDSLSTNKFVSATDKTTWNGKQDALVSGTNIKTINSQNILGSGDLTIDGGGLQGFYSSNGFSIDLRNDVEAGIYINKEDNFTLKIKGINGFERSSNCYFGFFVVTKKYSECSNKERFMFKRDQYGRLSEYYKDTSDTEGYVGTTVGGSFDWVSQRQVLTLGNYNSYTPTSDYNPATKKYVDDSIASAIGTALGGSY